MSDSLVTFLISFAVIFFGLSVGRAIFQNKQPEPVIYRAEIGNYGTRIDVLLKSSDTPASIHFTADGQVWIYTKDEPGVHLADVVKGESAE
jgi:hypothetical protein